jgi:hypothetical protein
MTTEPYDDSDIVISEPDQRNPPDTRNPAPPEPGIPPRKTAPKDKLGYSGSCQSFRVWANSPTYTEDTAPFWKCLAAFVYLQEALDYIAYCQDRGSDVVFQSPADCTLVKATDRRVVAK